MTTPSKASSFLEDLLDPDSELAQEIEAAQAEPEEATVQFVVYYVGNSPDTVWEYHHKPDDGIPYGRLYGYWDKTEDGSKKFTEHLSNNLKVMDFDHFMDNIVPDKGCTKLFDSEEDFLLELI